MAKGLFSSISEKAKKQSKTALPLYLAGILLGSLIMGVVVRFVMENLGSSIAGEAWRFRARLFIEPATWLIALVVAAMFAAIFAINGGFRSSGALGRGLLGGKSGDGDVVQGSLENSRFLTDAERDKYFPRFTYETLPEMKNDGVTAVDLHSTLNAVSAPQLCIPYVEIDGERIWLREGERVVIPREARRIRIYAYALTYSLEDPDVRCRLEGFDAEDSFAAASRLPVVSYTNLPGGSYTFRFALAEEGGAELRLELVKEKRLYEYSAVSAAGAVIVLALLAWFVSRLLKRQKLRLEAKGEEERIDSELRMAASIQADLLPKGDPAFPGRREFEVCASMRPAREIGGDFYDFFLIDEDHLALTVADVSGKGIPAALYMTMSKTLLKNTALHEKSPACVLREVNARLWENHETNMSVAVWLGILELSTGVLLWADAGHVRPLVRQKGRWTFVEKEKSAPLGTVDPEAFARAEGAGFADRELRMQPGDLLFQYTDGVIEAADRKKTAFGEDRLLAAMAQISSDELKEAGEQLRQELDGFTEKETQADDITMLLLRYHGPAGA